MRTLLLILITTISINSFSQKKKTTSIQPYSISNIKLGMSKESFLNLYSDFTPTNTSEKNSTSDLLYDRLVINDIEVQTVLVTFYKNKLSKLYFKTLSPEIHWGLKAKYGYDTENEYEEFYENEYVTLGYYGKLNASYSFTHIKFPDGEGFIMNDKKASQLSLKEGF